jgi:hypothetical protein
MLWLLGTELSSSQKQTRASTVFEPRCFRRIPHLSAGITPHVAQNHKRRGGSAIDGRTTRHSGYGISQSKEEANRRMFWLAEDDRPDAQAAAPWSL